MNHLSYSQELIELTQKISRDTPQVKKNFLENWTPAEIKLCLDADAPLQLIAHFKARLHEISMEGLSNYAIGRILLVQERYDEAKAHYKKAIDEGDNRAYGNLGSLLEMFGESEEAEKYYQQGTTSNAKTGTANFAMRRGDFVTAIQLYEDAIILAQAENFPEIAIMHYNAALCYTKLNQLDKALQQLSAGKKTHYDPIIFELIIVLETQIYSWQNGKLQVAIDSLYDAVAQHHHYSALVHIADIYTGLGEDEEAEKILALCKTVGYEIPHEALLNLQQIKLLRNLDLKNAPKA